MINVDYISLLNYLPTTNISLSFSKIVSHKLVYLRILLKVRHSNGRKRKTNKWVLPKSSNINHKYFIERNTQTCWGQKFRMMQKNYYDKRWTIIMMQTMGTARLWQSCFKLCFAPSNNALPKITSHTPTPSQLHLFLPLEYNQVVASF